MTNQLYPAGSTRPALPNYSFPSCSSTQCHLHGYGYNIDSMGFPYSLRTPKSEFGRRSYHLPNLEVRHESSLLTLTASRLALTASWLALTARMTLTTRLTPSRLVLTTWSTLIARLTPSRLALTTRLTLTAWQTLSRLPFHLYYLG